MELADVEAFLLLWDELHFGRTAERLYVSPARVSQRIRALEAEIGGALFARTSRRVALTPLGVQFRDDLRPAHAQLTAALSRARAAVRAPVGPLRVGCTATTGGPDMDRLLIAFARAQPECPVIVQELAIEDSVGPLRAGVVDVLVGWLFSGHAPGLTLGPAIAEYPRVLMVSAEHPLAGERSVSQEVLADHPVTNWEVQGDMRALQRSLVPTHTPSGRPVRFHPTPTRTVHEAISLIARNLTVHPTVASISRQSGRDDVVLIPIHDMEPARLGLIWVTAHENERIRALSAVAEGLGTTSDGHASPASARR